jgi:hypothetical protein
MAALGEYLDSILNKAGKAVYKAKEKGGNCLKNTKSCLYREDY